MNVRQLRARLDRLERSVNMIVRAGRDHCRDFAIDPELARALRDDYERLNELERKRWGSPLSTIEAEEECALRASLVEIAKKISCPASYGLREKGKDDRRLYQLWCKRRWPRGGLSDAEDAEGAQLTARILAFEQTPEGLARSRIRTLLLTGNISSSEKRELDSLEALYPEPPLDPDDPLRVAAEAWKAAAKRYEEEF
jgi:hypothetical protein